MSYVKHYGFDDEGNPRPDWLEQVGWFGTPKTPNTHSTGTHSMLVLDIETVPLAASLALPYPEADRNPPANYKSDDAITKWRASDRERWQQERAKECSLNPRLGRVLCIGAAEVTSPTSSITLACMAKTEAEEAEALGKFWTMAQRHDTIVTWNGQWDLRFLVIRSLAHGITPPLAPETIRAWFRKYTTAPHFDCKAVLTNWEPFKAGEGLSEWATFLGCDGKCDGISGADVFPMYERGEFSAIADYCRQDVAATLDVYRKIAPMFA